MIAMPAPTIGHLRAAMTVKLGFKPTIPNGVTAFTQRGRYVRVRQTGGTVKTSTVYAMAVPEDWRDDPQFRYKNIDAGTMLEAPAWAHYLFTPPCEGTAVLPLSGQVTRNTCSFESGQKLPPYEYVQADVYSDIGRYRLIAYGAYNAMGLIGSERNGIALLDNIEREVIADDIGITSSGWGGLSNDQATTWRHLARLMIEDRAGFAAVMNVLARTRLRKAVQA